MVSQKENDKFPAMEHRDTDYHAVNDEELKRAENIFKEIIVENFPNLGKELDIHVHKANNTIISMQKKKKTFSKTHYIKTDRSQG